MPLDMCVHQLSIDRTKQNQESFPATIKFFHSIGPVVFVELTLLQSEEHVEAELSKDEFSELKLNIGEVVYLRPREVRVFVQDFVI